MNTKPVHKEHLNVTIEHDLIEFARKQGINISETMEKGLREQLKLREVKISEPLKCEVCGKEMKQAYADHQTNEYHDGLTWLYPDERWICPSCLKNHSIALFRTNMKNAE